MVINRLKCILADRKGYTALEMMIAMMIFIFLTVGGLGLVVAGAASWHRDFTKGSLETETALGMRLVGDTLRNTVSIVVDNNGQGLTYYLPLTTGNPPRIVTPLTSDGVARRIERSDDGTQLFIDGRDRPIVTNLTPGSSSNRLFTLLPSGKAIVVNIQTRESDGQQYHSSHKSEVVELRNVP